jgi:hypothetical protein
MSDLETDVKDRSDAGLPREPKFAGANEPSYAQTLFFGPDGLRPGWGCAFYLVAFLTIQQFAVQLAWTRDFGDSGLWSRMLEEFGDILAAVIPAALRVNAGPGGYGLPKKQFGRMFDGAVWVLCNQCGDRCVVRSACVLPGHIVLYGERLLRLPPIGVFRAGRSV